MKIIAAVLFFFLTTELSLSGPFWTKQNSPTSQNLRDCIFINALTGWISGDSGTICKTTNAGDSWLIQQTGTDKEILDLFFLNERLGWAIIVDPLTKFPAPAGTTILKTTNGGTAWDHITFPDSSIYFSSICFTDSLNGSAGSFPYFMHYTTDGGFSWRQSASDSISLNGFPVLRIKYVSSSLGYACGGIRDLGGIVWKTTNGGRNWKPNILGPDNLNDIYLVNPDSLYVISGDFKFGASYFTTASAGINWHLKELGYFGICSSIDFRTPNEGWISLGYGQRFFFSRNGGSDWILMDTPDSSAIFDITFPDTTVGWAVGDNGCILKYDLKTNIDNEPAYEIHETFELNQNYPNPFNPQTTIEYKLYENSNVLLQIFSSDGRSIGTLVDSNIPAGNHRFIFKSNELASGTYFCVLTVKARYKKFVQTRKMVILK